MCQNCAEFNGELSKIAPKLIQMTEKINKDMIAKTLLEILFFHIT